MAIKKILLASTFSVLLAGGLCGQHQSRVLEVGGKLPDLLLKGIVDQGRHKVKIKELYKDGLLLIDFWATWCVPCLKEMVFLDSLKSEHPNKFKVLMVTYEDPTVVKKFFSRPSNSDLRHGNLLLLTKDSLFHSFFPHKVVPHNIWIDRNGIIKAITSHTEVTADNILNFTQRKDFTSLTFKKENMAFDPMQPFHMGDSVFTYRSIISGYLEGIGSGTYGGGAAPRLYFCWNASIVDHFWNAYSNSIGSMRKSMIEVHTSDSLQLFVPIGSDDYLLRGSKYANLEEWQRENAYSYALTLPDRVHDTVFREYMFNDLQRQFDDVRPTIEMRNINCNVVTQRAGLSLKKASGNANDYPDIHFIPGYKLRVQHARITDLLDWWFRSNTAEWEPDPYIFDIGASKNFYFDVELDFSDEVNNQNPSITPDLLYRRLEKYGFQFNRAIRPYPILVLHHSKRSDQQR